MIERMLQLMQNFAKSVNAADTFSSLHLEDVFLKETNSDKSSIKLLDTLLNNNNNNNQQQQKKETKKVKNKKQTKQSDEEDGGSGGSGSGRGGDEMRKILEQFALYISFISNRPLDYFDPNKFANLLRLLTCFYIWMDHNVSSTSTSTSSGDGDGGDVSVVCSQVQKIIREFYLASSSYALAFHKVHFCLGQT